MGERAKKRSITKQSGLVNTDEKRNADPVKGEEIDIAGSDDRDQYGSTTIRSVAELVHLAE